MRKLDTLQIIVKTSKCKLLIGQVSSLCISHNNNHIKGARIRLCVGETVHGHICALGWNNAS